MKHKTIVITNQVADFLNDVEVIYRKYHPELEHMFLSRNKLIYECVKFYLKGTELDLKYKNEK